MTRNQRALFLLISASLLLAGCLSAINPPALSPQPTNTNTKIQQSPTITPSVTLSPSATLTPTATTTQTPEPTATPTFIVAGPYGFPADVNPLTGLKVSDPKLLERRPVMIKVSNFPREGRPHAGLSYADIVFDYYIGEGTNRFLALYYGQDATKVGPIRSGRLVDAQLVRMYQGILGFASADQNLVYPTLLDNLGNRAITVAPATCPALCDDGTHTVFSVFANTAQLTQYAFEERNISASSVKENLEGMSFISSAPSNGQEATGLTVKFNAYNIAEWRYDPGTGRYLRWIESVDSNNNVNMVPLLDRDNNQQLAFSNIVILFAPYTEYAPTLHEIAMWYNTDGRRAVLFRDGKAIEGIWKSTNTDKPPQFTTSNGAPLPFKPGNTWIVITGINSTLQQPLMGKWEMRFFLP